MERKRLNKPALGGRHGGFAVEKFLVGGCRRAAGSCGLQHPRPAARRSIGVGAPGWPSARSRSLSGLPRDRTASRRRPAARWRRNRPGWPARARAGELPPAYFLAISGGGDNGAYGAGFLNGWTASGTRPEFKVVTGISTGALIAPFAFLGPKYDYVLERVYTTTAQKDIFKKRGLKSLLFGDAMADTRRWPMSSQPMSTARFPRRDRGGICQGPDPAGRHHQPRFAWSRSSGT